MENRHYMINNYTITIQDFLTAHYKIESCGADYLWNGYTQEEIIDAEYDKLFSFNFPWYDNTENAPISLMEFKKLFCMQYWNYQIGFETSAMFKNRLQAKLYRIMPYYSELFKSMNLEYDPLINNESTTTEDYNETNTNTKETNRNQTTSVTNDNQAIDSQNPQINYAGNDYASNMTRGQAKSSGTGSDVVKDSDSGNKTNKGSRTTKGFMGASKTDNIVKFRQAIININDRILQELDDLFLMVF